MTTGMLKKAAWYNEQCTIVGTGPQAIVNLTSSVPTVPLQECTGVQRYDNVHGDIDDDRDVFR